MFKAMILLKRAEGTSFRAFREWWLVDHKPLAAQLPGLMKAVFNLVDGEGEFDGVSELWFDSEEAFTAAYETDIGKRVAADSLVHVSRRERLLVSEVTVK